MIYSAGGIIQNPATGRIALVFQKNIQKWTFPKGKVEKGETYEQAAVREVYEETGIVATPAHFLGHACYKSHKTGKPKKKTVYYFVLDFIEQNRDAKLAKDIEKCQWYSIDEAYDLLALKRDRKILDAFAYGPDRRRI